MSGIETSVIIRTFNEGKHLPKLLGSILAQEYKDLEIIVVDSGSTDNTLEVARKYPVKIITIKQEDFSFGYSLNVGCKNAKGEYLIFISAHAYPLDDRWLGNMVRPFEDLKIGMVYGRQIGNEITKLSEEKDMINNFGKRSRILVEESFGNNANAAIRKSLWDSVSFDERLPGLEDIDWVHKIQKKGFYVYYNSEAVICHVHDETYKQIYNRFRREAIAYKTIFPDYDYNPRKAILISILAIVKDIYFGFSLKKPIKSVMGCFPYRYAEFRGLRDGYRHAGDLNRNLRNELYFPKKNRSVVISAPNRHQIRETDIPVLKDEEVLISVKYVGVCSTDLDVLKGNLDYYKSRWATYPIIPGHEFSGIVAATGQEVRELEVGDKVVGECILGCGECEYCLMNYPINCKSRKEVGVLNFNGAYSQYLKMPRRSVHKLPVDAQLGKACLIEPLAVSIRGVNKLVLGDNESPRNTAVLGFGAIGNLCAQLMSSKGHMVTVFDKNKLRIESIKKGKVVGRTQISELEDFDYIIEATGQPEVLKRALHESRPGAKVLLLGLPYSVINFNFESIVSFDKTVIGSVGSTNVEFAEAIAIYKKLDLESLVQNIFSFEDYEMAWNKQKNGEVTKALIRINGSNV